MCGYRKGYFSTQVLGLLILSPIFGTSNPGLNSSVAPLTLELWKVAQNEEERSSSFSWANKIQ